jgi:hypothetical protein
MVLFLHVSSSILLKHNKDDVFAAKESNTQVKLLRLGALNPSHGSFFLRKFIRSDEYQMP